MYKIKEEKMKVPSLIWSTEGSIEEKAIEQIKNASSLPFAFHHTALMPDGHMGYGAPIGGVLATEGVIVPNFVGVDIGCGMCAVKTSLTEIDTETLKKILGEIRKEVPVGFSKHQIKPGDVKWEEHERLLPSYDDLPRDSIGHTNGVVDREYTNSIVSLGTLGGGNHFIEIQKGSDGHIWIMVHSGSRNLGKQVADYYNKAAIELNKKWFSPIPPEWELAFLPTDSEEGQNYIKEMNYCIEFALANRELMMERIKDIFADIVPKSIEIKNSTDNFVAFYPIINIAHNYAKLENHMGKNVWVHRKGATLADNGTIGIIPGSQGTKSYIVEGKGNVLSFKSCSHGAGRKMGRKQAQKNLNLEKEIKMLDNQHIIHAIRGTDQLDEAPGAYKDIDVVMKNQEDLVKILVELTPLAVIKG